MRFRSAISDALYRFRYGSNRLSKSENTNVPKLSLYSVYCESINPEIVRLQAAVFAHLGLTLNQVMYAKRDADFKTRYDGHGEAIERIIVESAASSMIIFDIDCIVTSLEFVENVYQPIIESGALVGPIQVANHLSDRRPYAAPFALGMSKSLYRRLGSPRLTQNHHVDVAAILTRECERRGIPVVKFPVTDCIDPKWPLSGTGAPEFGYGTTYANSIFHAFGVSDGSGEKIFIEKCNSILRCS